jgi:alanine dehydrogenase
VVHYCVANMPGAYARTATFALTNVTTPYAVQIADKGWLAAARENAEIAKGLNVIHGQVTNQPVSQAHRLRYVPWTKVDT